MDAVRLSWQLEDRGLIVDLDDDNRLVVLGGMLDVVRHRALGRVGAEVRRTMCWRVGFCAASGGEAIRTYRAMKPYLPVSKSPMRTAASPSLNEPASSNCGLMTYVPVLSMKPYLPVS